LSSVAARSLPVPPRVAASDGERDTPATLALRLAAFAAFAAYGAAHWSMLVADPSTGATAATVAAAVGCAVALTLLDRSRLPRSAILPLAAVVAVAALVAGLAATGLAPRLLAPSGWSELADQLDRARFGVQSVDWPYDGPDEWIRRTILLGAPLLLTTAAALAFWPAAAAARQPLRLAAAAALIATYAIAVTTKSPGSPLLFGALLLASIAAWLWLPRLAGRELAVGAGAVAAAAVLSLPIATALDGERPWVDYRSWSFGDDSGIAFDWTHGYGPLDWPRQGTTLLSVRSDEPHYWKAQTLDSFDGVRWHRSSASDEARELDAELPFDSGSFFEPGVWTYGAANPDWNHQIHVTVRSLSSELLIGAGLTYDVQGVSALPSADGTTRLLGDPLERGDGYTIRAYEPAPDSIQLGGAPEGYPAWAERYTELVVPSAGADPASASFSEVVVPPRGNRAPVAERGAAARRLADSAYGRTYALVQELTGDSTSVFDAVQTIEAHLLDSYRYGERVPEHAYPLESFLFEDRRGYCQQFSGAMALMLRMAGIPARVAAGFSPGTPDRKTGEYRVRDLDAHSWVEVYFRGIGWVPFDPTPGVAEAASQGAATPGSGGDGGEAGAVRQDSSAPGGVAPGADDGPSAGDVGDAGQPGSGTGAALPTAALLVAAGLGALALMCGLTFALRVRRRRTLDRERLAEAEIAELRHALGRLGWDVSPSTTLLAIERRLAATAGPAAAAYAHGLRSYRFDPQRGEPPGAVERRRLRRALAAGAGPLGRLRVLLAVPPGGPGRYSTAM
jgi:transglutaminase-like putative cysteine protease